LKWALAAAVLVSGCHIGDCHYIDANHHTKRRVEKLWNLLEKNGIDKNRLQLAWISAAEGEKFAQKIKEMDEIVKSVSKDEIQKTVKWLKERKAQKAKKEKKKADEKVVKEKEIEKEEEENVKTGADSG